MDSVTVCKNCKHSVSGFKLPYISDKWDWKHYQKKRGSERGTRQIRCFSCECEKPEPFVPNAGHLNSNHLKKIISPINISTACNTPETLLDITP